MTDRVNARLAIRISTGGQAGNRAVHAYLRRPAHLLLLAPTLPGRLLHAACWPAWWRSPSHPPPPHHDPFRPADVQPDVPEGVDPSTAKNATHAAVLLWYTHSHYGVGTGQATCSGGCSCERQALEPHIRGLFGTQVGARCCAAPACHRSHLLRFGSQLRSRHVLHGLLSPGRVICLPPPGAGAHRASRLPLPRWQDHLHLFMVTRSPSCVLTIETLPGTTTGGCVWAPAIEARRLCRPDLLCWPALARAVLCCLGLSCVCSREIWSRNAC